MSSPKRKDSPANASVEEPPTKDLKQGDSDTKPILMAFTSEDGELYLYSVTPQAWNERLGPLRAELEKSQPTYPSEFTDIVWDECQKPGFTRIKSGVTYDNFQDVDLSRYSKLIVVPAWC